MLTHACKCDVIHAYTDVCIQQEYSSRQGKDLTIYVSLRDTFEVRIYTRTNREIHRGRDASRTERNNTQLLLLMLCVCVSCSCTRVNSSAVLVHPACIPGMVNKMANNARQQRIIFVQQ